MKLIPAREQIIVTEPPAKEGPLVLAQASKERPQMGIIHAIGKGISDYSPGDVVCFTRFNINELKDIPGVDGTYYVMKEDQILVKVEK